MASCLWDSRLGCSFPSRSPWSVEFSSTWHPELGGLPLGEPTRLVFPVFRSIYGRAATLLWSGGAGGGVADILPDFGGVAGGAGATCG